MTEQEIEQWVKEECKFTPISNWPVKPVVIENNKITWSGQLTINNVPRELGHVPLPLDGSGSISFYGHETSFDNFPNLNFRGHITIRHSSLVNGLNGITQKFGKFVLYGCQLKNLKGFPRTCTKVVIAYPGYSVDLLEGIQGSFIKTKITIPYLPTMPLMKLFTVSGLSEGLEFRNEDEYEAKILSDVETIINRYLGKGKSYMLPCAAELIKAGYRSHARY